MEPFSTPWLALVDTLRCYIAMATIGISIRLLVQLIHGQPGLPRDLQVARRLMLSAMTIVLVGDAGAGLTRLGSPDTIVSRLVAAAVGVTLLLVWLRFESKARKAATRDP